MRLKERLKGVQGMFNAFKGSSIYIQEFKRSIPLHFDMLNATPYSLSKEGNLILKSMNRFKGSIGSNIQSGK